MQNKPPALPALPAFISTAASHELNQIMPYRLPLEDEELCPSQWSPTGNAPLFICTRSAGHTQPHIALNQDLAIVAMWTTREAREVEQS
jgi:hypothetical protein